MSNKCIDCCFYALEAVAKYSRTFDAPRCAHPSNIRDYSDVLNGSYIAYAVLDINMVRQQFEDIRHCPNFEKEEAQVGLLESLLV